MDAVEQHKRRMAHMPWLYHRAKPAILEWARPWQSAVQDRLCEAEEVRLGDDCFVAPDAAVFAEPNRPVVMGDGCSVAAGCYVHGPVSLGEHVSLNVGCHLDGGRAGIAIGDDTRIAAGVRMFAWNHGIEPDSPVREQPVQSHGIRIGRDVWIGSGAGIVDGVTIGDHAVVGLNAVVTRDVAPWAIVAGSPARVIGDRRTRKG